MKKIFVTGAFLIGLSNSSHAVADTASERLDAMVGNWQGQSLEGRPATLMLAADERLGQSHQGTFVYETAVGQKTLAFKVSMFEEGLFIEPQNDQAGGAVYNLSQSPRALRFVRLVIDTTDTTITRYTETIALEKIENRDAVEVSIASGQPLCTDLDGENARLCGFPYVYDYRLQASVAE